MYTANVDVGSFPPLTIITGKQGSPRDTGGSWQKGNNIMAVKGLQLPRMGHCVPSETDKTDQNSMCTKVGGLQPSEPDVVLANIIGQTLAELSHNWTEVGDCC